MILSSADHIVIEEHKEPINAVAWSPDGKYFASAAKDKALILWNAENLEDRRVIGIKGESKLLSWAPNSTLLAIVVDDIKICVYDVGLRGITAELVGHTDKITAISWDPRSEKIVSSSYDKTTKIWVVKDEDCVQTLRGHLGAVLTADWDKKKGIYIATGGSDRNVFVWFTGQWSIVSRLRGHLGPIISAHWNPNYDILASVCEGGIIRFWKCATWKCVKAIRCPTKIISMKWSPNGEYIAAACEDGVIRVWNLEGELIKELRGHVGSVNTIDWSHDSKKILSGGQDRTIRIWSLDQDTP